MKQLLNVLLALSSALMMYKACCLLANTDFPFVVVLSESMEPAFQRGDVLFLYNSSAPVKVGDICVFNIPNARSKIPVVHRFLWIHEHSVTRNEASRQYLKSKGDNNPVDDYLGGIYPREREWMNQENLVGTVYAMTPSWGWLIILINENERVKWIIWSILGFTSLYE